MAKGSGNVRSSAASSQNNKNRAVNAKKSAVVGVERKEVFESINSVNAFKKEFPISIPSSAKKQDDAIVFTEKGRTIRGWMNQSGFADRVTDKYNYRNDKLIELQPQRETKNEIDTYDGGETIRVTNQQTQEFGFKHNNKIYRIFQERNKTPRNGVTYTYRIRVQKE